MYESSPAPSKRVTPSFLEGRLLFHENERYDLSELSQDPTAFHLMSAGASAATINGIGIRHRDLHLNHLFFNFASGKMGIIDFGASDFGDVSAVRMVDEFIAPFLSLSRPEFCCFLSGYIQHSRIFIDVVKPGFTASLLGRLGGHATLPEFELRADLWSTAADAIGISITSKSDGVSAEQYRSLETSSPVSAEAAILPAILAACGCDISAIVPSVSRLNVSYDTRVQTIAQLSDAVIELLSQLPQEHRTLDDRALRCFFQCARDVNRQDGTSFLELAGHALMFVAKTCYDAELPQQFAFRAARTAVILHNSLIGFDSQRDESMCLSVAAADHQSGWSPIPSKLDSEISDVQTAIAATAYRNSLARLYAEAFGYSIRAPSDNCLWSWVWRAMTLNRRSLVATLHLAPEHSSHPYAQDIRAIAGSAAVQQLRCLKTIGTRFLLHLGRWELYVKESGQRERLSLEYEIEQITQFLDSLKLPGDEPNWNFLAALEPMYKSWNILGGTKNEAEHPSGSRCSTPTRA